MCADVVAWPNWFAKEAEKVPDADENYAALAEGPRFQGRERSGSHCQAAGIGACGMDQAVAGRGRTRQTSGGEEGKAANTGDAAGAGTRAEGIRYSK